LDVVPAGFVGVTVPVSDTNVSPTNSSRRAAKHTIPTSTTNTNSTIAHATIRRICGYRIARVKRVQPDDNVRMVEVDASLETEEDTGIEQYE